MRNFSSEKLVLVIGEHAVDGGSVNKGPPSLRCEDVFLDCLDLVSVSTVNARPGEGTNVLHKVSSIAATSVAVTTLLRLLRLTRRDGLAACWRGILEQQILANSCSTSRIVSGRCLSVRFILASVGD
jgi:hypothetical protein